MKDFVFQRALGPLGPLGPGTRARDQGTRAQGPGPNKGKYGDYPDFQDFQNFWVFKAFSVFEGFPGIPRGPWAPPSPSGTIKSGESVFGLSTFPDVRLIVRRFLCIV